MLCRRRPSHTNLRQNAPGSFPTRLQHRMRCTVHLWADRRRAKCPWADAYYWHKLEQGMSHAAALRCLAMRWLKIIWKMWIERKAYDGERHLRDQVKHGSWVISLMPQSAL